SKKYKTVADVKEGARVAVPNDPTNLARTFVFLEQYGLVKAKPGVDPLKVTEKDIAENPKKLKFIPLEAAQLPRALDDTDFSVINGNFAISSGLKLTEAVALEKTPDYYLLVAAVRTADKGAPWVADLAEAFKTPFFKDVLNKHFPGYARPAALQ
ncbi:MAG: MetQ/NlpA family ABC transporter substrate-binding protein, partial [Hydrogenophaga sp.]|uniref:MetQ/NlpA family ABC transporter substrate-binding protein n=1 Tax=Hydrogenophaga sp. TaxID=1904254 RepID=UPI002621C5CA